MRSLLIVVTCVVLCAAVAGCFETDIRNSPEYTLARMRHEIADSQATSLSSGLAFFKAATTLAEAEQAYRECLAQAQMATASIPDVVTRRLREHEVTVTGMKARGFFQTTTAPGGAAAAA